MPKQMIFNCSDYEIRIAILDNQILSNLYIEREDQKSIAGNIYVGKVVRVLPGMQAAFVDIGLERAAFLHVSDACHDITDLSFIINEEDETDSEETVGYENAFRQRGMEYEIEDVLKEGQELLVQIAKEPVGTKGARLTTYISLPGRNLVLIPSVQHIGISRQITDESERQRLRDILEEIRPEGFGIIARTVSEGKQKDELRNDIDYLSRLWTIIRKKRENTGVPALIHKDIGIVIRAIRDFYTIDVETIHVDSRGVCDRIIEFLETFIPDLKYNVKLYEGEKPIFDTFGIELDIKKALNKRVWLKSGGYIIIEETEALCAIDVNTGKYVGKRNLEDTILSTNMEAVKEIAYQIRLRNIAGIIIIDFIDMESEENREMVFNALVEEMKNDKSKTKIQKISEVGLIEMTRQRKGRSLSRVLCEPCPSCEGTGVIKSKTTICYEIFRELRRERASTLQKKICILVHPDVANLLLEDEKSTIDILQEELNKQIIIKVDQSFYQEDFQIIPLQ